jgi:hypothetical protein
MSSESKSEQLEWLENRLEEMERSHSIPSCWLPTDEEYKKSEYAVLLTKKEQILMQIWKSGQSRLFLLQLKRRYADGQKIAKKLSLQISKATKAIQSQLEEYKVSTEDTMTLSEALDPSAVETRLHQLGSWGAIATGRRREIIDAYLALCRSNEEIEMLEQDARNCIAFYERKKEVITSELLYRSVNSDPYNRGAAALLMDLMHQTSHLLTDSIKTLGIISTRIHQQNIEDDYSDISSSTCSEDSFDESEHI